MGWGERTVHVIAPTLELHGLMLIDPGLVRINADYGWMRADDVINGRTVEFDAVLLDRIVRDRCRVWFEEALLLGLVPGGPPGDATKLAQAREDLHRSVVEREVAGRSLPPGYERWSHIGEAHSQNRGDAPIVAGQSPLGGDAIVAATMHSGQPVVLFVDGETAISSRNHTHNAARRVLGSTTHVEPLVGGLVGWRPVGHSSFGVVSALTTFRSSGRMTALGVDENGVVIVGYSQADEMAYSGWLPLSDGVTVPGGWASGVSRNQWASDVFMVNPQGVVMSAASELPLGRWSSWFQLGVSPNAPFVAGSPIAAVSRRLDHLDLFGVDVNGTPQTAAWSPSTGWRGWWNLPSGGASPGAHIAAISAAEDVLDVLMIGTDGQVYRCFWSPPTGWQPWALISLAGTRFRGTAHIDVTSPSPGEVVASLADTAGTAWLISYNVSDRASTATAAISGPQMVLGRVANTSWKDTNVPTVSMFACATDGSVVRSDRASGGTPSPWVAQTAPTGTVAPTPPSTVPTAGPFVHGVGIGTTDRVDQIGVRVGTGGPATMVTFVLEAGPGVTWEKHLSFHLTASSPATRLASVKDSTKRAECVIPASLVASPGASLRFAKAKTFGIMEGVRTDRLGTIAGGTVLTFLWTADT